MTEKGYFDADGVKLAYILNEGKKEAGVVFVHAAWGTRLGPHRMFVELGRKFNEMGHAIFRFDFAGCGDSEGVADYSDLTGETEQLVSAVSFFRKRCNVKNVILFGISRGARICIEALMSGEAGILGAILLSPPGDGGKSSVGNIFGRCKEYVCKLAIRDERKKFFTGRADYGQILKTLVFAGRVKRRYLSANGSIGKDSRLLFIYGENDPLMRLSLEQYQRKLEGGDSSVDFRVISGANHSFFHYKWKDEIFDICSKWLEGGQDGD